MRKAIIILLLLIPSMARGTSYYVATTGSDSYPGTLSQPFASWHYAFNKLKAGDILYVRGGTYTALMGAYGSNYFGVRVEGVSGTSGSPITVTAYNGEVPILDGSSLTSVKGSNIGIGLYSCNYWDITGLTVTNFTQNSVNAYSCPGWVESDCSQIAHTLCTVHECGDGYVLWGSKDYIYYTNCDAYQNADHMNDSGGEGGLANGFAAGLVKGEHVFYQGCRAWQNSDDGWDCFNSSGGSGYIQYLNCWAFENGAYGGVTGDGDGFKLGISVSSADGGFQRILKNCLSANNLEFGYDQNDGGYGTLIPMSLYNCSSYNNTKGAFNFRDGSSSAIRNCASFNETLGDVGSNIVDHNSWQNGITVSAADFSDVNEKALAGPRKSDGSLPDIGFMHLASGSDLIDAGTDVGLPYSGNAPDLGAFEFQAGTPPPAPVYVSSTVANATPSIVEMTYSLTLANIVPAVTAFSVKINSTVRSITLVAVSGTKVMLTLSSPVVNGDNITISYTQPSSNALQTASGSLAASISDVTVTNGVLSAIPVYVSSLVQNTTPSIVEMTYKLALANIVPAVSAFTVRVNSSSRTITTVIVSGTKVQLTLSAPVVYGDVITVSYTQPSANPLQTSSGGKAASISAQTVSNLVNPALPVYISSVVQNTSPSVISVTYNLSLTNIVPAASAFKILVNSSSRTISNVSVSGTIVQLTISTPVIYGDIITVSYTQPSANPLQTSSGGKAASISAQTVSNLVNPALPVYISSVVQNTSPSVISITYNLSLANIVPAASAFKILVNSSSRTISKVAVSGTMVQLTISTPVAYGDVITVSYTQPSSNPLQTSAGGKAATINPQPVTNQVSQIIPVYVSSVVQNTSPTITEITFSQSLTNIVPLASAFKILVNSVSRTVSLVTVSGTLVQLTLTTPVAFGDIITLSYTKPAANQLQTASGAQVSSFTAQPVTNNVSAPLPLYVSSVIQNTTPNVVEMTYNLALANIAPDASSFSVRVNSSLRAINQVAISGSRVILTLSASIVYGDIVTVSYTKPVSKPLQTSDGGQAASISNQAVTNQVISSIPVFVSSTVQNTAPSIVEITYNLTLANFVPSVAAFSVKINSAGRSITLVAVSGTKVQLTLSAPVVYGDIITVSYTQPALNPLQTVSGGLAATFSSETVTNGILLPIPVYVSSLVQDASPAIVEMTYRLALADITPAISTFSVRVNSSSRTITNIAVSGTKVLLTLSAPVVYGDIITVSYTQPSLNPLQTPAGGKAASFSAQAVTNLVNPIPPAYISSVVQNASPSVIAMTYNLSLANIVPAITAFSILVNSKAVTISKVAVSGTQVQLTISAPVVYGDIITVSYAQPATNPLQTTAGGKAASISAQPVTNQVSQVIPVYVSSIIQNSSPAVTELTFSQNLANVVPLPSAFNVLVNSVSCAVSDVTVSGALVQLTLSTPVVHGDAITVSYAKPSANPLQTASGVQAPSFTNQPVTNNVNAPLPVYASSVVQNASPNVLEMTYNLTLANIVPSASAFSVRINSSSRTITQVTITGSRVTLTLSVAVLFGDIVTISYTKPALNQLQTSAGVQAASISNQAVTNQVLSTIPEYVSATVQNETPSIIEMTYDMSLANIVPALSAFSVRINSVATTINNVTVSGTRVMLTLSSPILYGDIISLSYIRPSRNALQTPSGGRAITITSKPVSNQVGSENPLYITSSIQNETPNILEITYNMDLANIVPSNSFFVVSVNALAQKVISVAISGSNVLLALESTVKFGDTVTVSYTKPSANPIQSVTGAQADGIDAQPVTNYCYDNIKSNDAPVVMIKYPVTVYSGFVNEIDASSSYDPNNDSMIVEWIVPDSIPVSDFNNLKSEFLAPVIENSKVVNFGLRVSDGITIVTNNIPINILPYKPELEEIKISSIYASGFQLSNFPANVLDNNTSTNWSSDGDNEWLQLEFASPFKISHLEIAFLKGQKYESYFDIYASADNIIWDPVLTGVSSCKFSGEKQIFNVPMLYTNTTYSFLKIIGHGNSVNQLNDISEVKLFGISEESPKTEINNSDSFSVYPNPAHNFITIFINEPAAVTDFVRIVDLTGKLIYEDSVFQGINTIEFTTVFKPGIYLVELRSGINILNSRKLIIDK